jgi:hypothetical protein
VCRTLLLYESRPGGLRIIIDKGYSLRVSTMDNGPRKCGSHSIQTPNRGKGRICHSLIVIALLQAVMGPASMSALQVAILTHVL